MHNGQLWIYIIVGLIYFLAKMSKKKAPKQSARPVKPRETQPRRAPTAAPKAERPEPEGKPLTFEEMLREIMEAKREPAEPPPPPPPPTAPSPQPTYVDYDDNLEDGEKEYEQVELARAKNPEAVGYAEGLREAFNRPSLDEDATLRSARAGEGRFKTFENSPENKIFGEYIESLKDPEGFKKAFILSELLNRKHF